MTAMRLANSETAVDRACRWLGAASICFYIIHGAWHLQAGRPESLLWTCFVGDLLIGCGLLLKWRWLNTAGTLMLCIGAPVCALDVASGAEFIPTTLLVHIGGTLCGLVGIFLLGVGRRDWWTALAIVAGLILTSRFVTPPSENVNLVFHSWFRSHTDAAAWLHVPYLLLAWGLALWAVNRLFVMARRLWNREWTRMDGGIRGQG